MLWARVYTLGLPRDLRYDRLAELECDLWESRHDQERRSTAIEVLGRWLTGLIDDLRWRLAYATLKEVTVFALATTAVAVSVWAYATLLAPQALPRPHGKPMGFAADGASPASSPRPSPPR